MTDVGDKVPITLTVTPADATTQATVTAQLLPAGAPIALPAVPNGDRTVWTANLSVTALGAYRVVWTVTGTGAGVEHDTVHVLGGPDPIAGQSYASLHQLAIYLDEAPPTGARRLLVRASRKVDDMLRTAVYAVDAAGLPTDPAVATALAEATCAQVAWWSELGDDTGSGAVAALAGSQIGTVKLGTGAGGAGLPECAPDAVQVLRRAGLLNHGPQVLGSWGYR